ncbi:MAG: hypothetical protein MAG451_02883 [Anaerolineales bacterium]|nr:hypothetical protein [Anaerolineales bacterium]
MNTYWKRRYAETKDFLTRVWHLDNDERPAYYVGVAIDAEESMLDRFTNPERMLRHQLREIEVREKIKDDAVPTLYPYLGTGAFASAFGCEVTWYEDDHPWANALIYGNPDRVYALEQPKPTDGLLGEVLDYTRHFLDRTGDGYPIRVTDLQGPVDTAYLIWNSDDFLVAMYTNPEEVHHLLGMVTQLIIEFVTEQRRLVEDFVPCHLQPWLPDGFGLTVSDDAMALLSPDLYEEFAVPYLNQLSEAFNGVFVHSCGNVEHNLESLKKVHKLRGINFGATETPFESVVEAFSGEVVICPHVGLNKDITFDSIFEYLEHVLITKQTNRGLYVLIDPTNSLLPATMKWTEEELQRFYALIERYV